MRVWKGIDPPKDIDPRVYEILKRLNEGATQTTRSITTVERVVNNGVFDHGLLTGLVPVGTDENDDHSQYVNNRGRIGGQTVLGSPKLTNAGTDVGITFRSFNGDPTDISAGPAQISLLDMIGRISCPGTLYITTRSTDTKGLVFDSGGANFVNATLDGTLKITPTGTTEKFLIMETASVDTTYGANKDDVIFRRLTSRLTGNFALFESSNSIGGARVTLSSIRKSDGAWVGPIVASLSAGSFIDNVFSIVDDGDNSKVLQFQCSGITTATTRTLTVPDRDGTILLNVGAASGSSYGQTIGVSNHAGSSITNPQYCLAVEGSLQVGDSLGSGGFTAGQGLTVKQNAINGGVGALISYNLAGIAAGAASSTTSALRVEYTGTPGWTSGTAAILRGFGFVTILTVPGSVTITDCIGTHVDSIFATTAGQGTVTNYIGYRAELKGGTVNGPAVTNVIGFQSAPGWRAAMAPTGVFGFQAIKLSTITYGTGPAAVAAAFEVDSTFAATANVTVWSALRVPAIAGPGTIWGLNITGTMNNRLGGSLTIGSSATPTATLDVDGDATIGLTAVSTNVQIGVSTTENVSSTLTLRSGSAATSQARIRLGSDSTDYVQLNYNQSDTFFDFTGNWFIRTGMNGTVRATMASDGKFRIGDTAAPLHWLDLASGTTTIAPLRMAAGTNLTSPVAGAMEFDGTNFSMSPTAVRQTVALMPRVRALASFRI